MLDDLIAKMSEGAKAAVCGRWEWASPMEAEDGESELCVLGLWAKDRRGRLDHTPLGLEVRARLKEMEG